jgi:hypothetical protein
MSDVTAHRGTRPPPGSGSASRCTAPGSTCTLPKATGAGILQAAHDTGMGVIQLVVTIAPLRSGSSSVPLAFSVA